MGANDAASVSEHICVHECISYSSRACTLVSTKQTLDHLQYQGLTSFAQTRNEYNDDPTYDDMVCTRAYMHIVCSNTTLAYTTEFIHAYVHSNQSQVNEAAYEPEKSSSGLTGADILRANLYVIECRL